MDLASIERCLGALDPYSIPASVAPRRAAVAIILRAVSEDQDWELLFILRARHREDPWSGHMAFPGGRVDDGDATSLSAARRETAEEIGLDLNTCSRLLGSIDDIHASAGGKVLPLAISPYVFLITGGVETTPNHEVDEVHWIRVSELLDPATRSTTPYTLRGVHFDLPCFRVRHRVIWGLTYQMLMRLFTVLKWDPEVAW